MLVVFGWGKDENLTAVIHQVKTRTETKQEALCCEQVDDSSDEGKFKNKAFQKDLSFSEHISRRLSN